MFKDLVYQNRSFRRFDESQAITRETLRELVDLARCSASGGNRQPLKYILSCEPERNEQIFQLINLARPNREIRHPPEGERPTGYIIILGDKEIRENSTPDQGIAAQSITLGAREKGLGCCMVGMIRRDKMMETLKIPPHYQILLVIAIGKPAEEVKMEGLRDDGTTAFYWDDQGVFHVPKRSLDDIIIASYEP